MHIRAGRCFSATPFLESVPSRARGLRNGPICGLSDVFAPIVTCRCYDPFADFPPLSGGIFMRILMTRLLTVVVTAATLIAGTGFAMADPEFNPFFQLFGGGSRGGAGPIPRSIVEFPNNYA